MYSMEDVIMLKLIRFVAGVFGILCIAHGGVLHYLNAPWYETTILYLIGAILISESK